MLIREKIEQARGLLNELGLDCWLTFVRETQIAPDPALAFLALSHLTWPSALIVTPGGAHAIVGELDRRTLEDLQAYGRVEGYVQGIGEPLIRYLSALDPARIAINYSKDSEVCDGLTHGMYLRLVEMLAESGLDKRLVSAEALISALRARKTAAEIARLREAVRLTEEIYAKVAGFLAPGKTEREVAAFIRARMDEAGLPPAWEASTCPAVFTGPDTAGAHYGPTLRAIERGHIVNMDFGVKYEEYCSDLQRTFYVLRDGERQAPAEVQRGFDTIVAAIEAARRAMAPGVPGVEVDKVARQAIVEAGYAEFPHGLGHQVGRYAHDGTALLGPAWEKYARRPFLPIEAGMVFTIEPRLTVPGFGVATIEEMVVVGEDGAEFLSNAQRELVLIGG